MVTETYDEQTAQTMRYKLLSGTPANRTYTGFRNAGSRTFIRRKKPLAKFIVPTPYEVSANNHFIPPWDATVTGHSNIVGITGGLDYANAVPFNTTWPALPAYSSNLYNGVLTDLRLKVKDQKVNLGLAYAEKRMTANLLADTLTRIARSYQYLRKGNWKAAQRQLTRKKNERIVKALQRKHPFTWENAYRKPASAWKQAPASWLEYQYAWNPLLQDVYGSMALLEELDQPVHWEMYQKAGRKEIATEVMDHVFSDSVIQGQLHCERETFRGIFARVDYHPTSQFFQSLTSNSGITNPALLAWELFPFSFVIDWGFQAGNWISSLDATLFMELVGMSITDRRETNATVVPVDSTINGKTVRWTKPKPAKYRQFRLSRTVYSSWPVASAPRFKDPTSLTHVANALSLLTEVLRGGPLRLR